jgi:hypothetical protein
MAVLLSIAFKGKNGVSIAFPNAAEARRELVHRAGTMRREGDGKAGVLLRAGRVEAKYCIAELPERCGSHFTRTVAGAGSFTFQCEQYAGHDTAHRFAYQIWDSKDADQDQTSKV